MCSYRDIVRLETGDIQIIIMHTKSTNDIYLEVVLLVVIWLSLVETHDYELLFLTSFILKETFSCLFEGKGYKLRFLAT